MSNDSVRKDILLNIQEVFQGIAPPDPSDPPDPDAWPFAFGEVTIGPLDLQDHRRAYSLGIVPGRETERHTFPYIECMLPISLEFRVTVNRGDNGALLAEDTLTVIKRVIDQNRKWTDAVVDTKRVSNETDLTSSDRSIFGVQIIEVMYRTSHLDPRDAQPDL